MNVSITENAIQELSATIGELDRLTNKPGNLSRKEEQRHSFLLAKLAFLKQGVSVGELRRFEQDRLLAAAGLPRDPAPARTRLGEETEAEWRSFALGKEVRATHVPPVTEIRANEAGQQSITTTQGPAGGYFVAPGMHGRAFETMKQYDQVFDEKFSNIVETETGAVTAFPIWDDVSNSSVQVGETVQSTEVDVANFGSTQLHAWAFRSKIVAVSLELLQDSNFPIGQVLERVFAMRHARGVGAALVTGSGTNAPTGLLTATVASGAIPIVASGSSANTGGAETGSTTIGTQDIGKLYAKLDPMYRSGAAWYMADGTVQYLAQLLDKNGRPIVSFRKGLEDDGEYVLYGKPVAVCASMPSMGAAANPVLFGNAAYFVQRRVPSSMYVRRFWENPTLVQYGLIGFESWLRVDSGLVAPNASALPYQYLQMHS